MAAAAKAAWATGDLPEEVAAGLLGLYQKMGAGQVILAGALYASVRFLWQQAEGVGGG